VATDDPSGGPTSGQQPPQADASPREAGARGRRRPPPTIDLPAKDLTPPEDKVTEDRASEERTPGDETAEAAVAEERAAEERAAEEKAAYLGAEAGANAAPNSDGTSAAPPPPPPAAPAPGRSLGFLAGLLIALLSGLIGGAIAVMVALSFLGPAESIDALTDLEARTVELRQRTDALEARPPADPSAGVAALGQRLDALTATLGGVEGKVSALASAPPAAAAPSTDAPAAVSPELSARLDAVEALAKQASAAPAAASPELNARLDAVEALAKQASAQASDAATQASNAATQATSATERPTVSPDALTALGDKLTGLEQRVAAVAKANEASARGAAQLAALGTLREAVLRGVPFAAELAAARSLLGPPGDVLQPLDAYAAGGVPTGPVLLQRLTAAKAQESTASTAPAPAAASPTAEAPAAPAPADEGFFAKLTRSAEGLVSVRRAEGTAAATSSETDAAYGRVAAALSRDDMAGAAREIEALPAEAREAAQPIAADIAARSKALADIDTLNRQILAGLAGSAP
jgi:hypothetical protein